MPLLRKMMVEEMALGRVCKARDGYAHYKPQDG